MSIPVYFAGRVLSTISGVTFRKRRVYKLPTRNNKLYKRAMRDGRKHVRSEYNDRALVLEGDISRASRALMEASRDTLMEYLQPVDEKLEFEQAGALRRYMATMRNVIMTEDMGGFAPFSIEFDLSLPFGVDINLTTLLNNVNHNSSSTDHAITIGGSVFAEPLITLTLTSITGGTNASVLIENPATGQGITVQRSFSNSDVVKVDVDAHKVYVNDVEVEYSGAFPTWDVGSGTLRVTDDFSTVASTVLMTYRKRYL